MESKLLGIWIFKEGFFFPEFKGDEYFELTGKRYYFKAPDVEVLIFKEKAELIHLGISKIPEYERKYYDEPNIYESHSFSPGYYDIENKKIFSAFLEGSFELLSEDLLQIEENYTFDSEAKIPIELKFTDPDSQKMWEMLRTGSKEINFYNKYILKKFYREENEELYNFIMEYLKQQDSNQDK